MMTDWERIKRIAGNGEYLFCSLERLDDPDGSWLKTFCEEAPEHGCSVKIMLGKVYVVVDKGDTDG